MSKQTIKCDGDNQMVTLVKMINGFPTIVRKRYKDTTIDELNGQSTCILRDMMSGNIMTRSRARIKHGCEKMLTRMSEIRRALIKHGVNLIEMSYMSSRGKECKNFKLSGESIKMIEDIDYKTTNYKGACSVCKTVFEVAGSNHSHFKSSILPTLRHCCGKPVEFKEVVK